jgi:hypothetical protein
VWCVLRKRTALLHLGFGDDLTAMICVDAVHKWWWWWCVANCVVPGHGGVEQENLFLVLSGLGVEELLQSLKA